ncbi:hypothetical protein HNY73_011574, partial [Argiope bruennichi]
EITDHKEEGGGVSKENEEVKTTCENRFQFLLKKIRRPITPSLSNELANPGGDHIPDKERQAISTTWKHLEGRETAGPEYRYRLTKDTIQCKQNFK